jgi:hypothetical protein
VQFLRAEQEELRLLKKAFSPLGEGKKKAGTNQIVPAFAVIGDIPCQITLP